MKIFAQKLLDVKMRCTNVDKRKSNILTIAILFKVLPLIKEQHNLNVLAKKTNIGTQLGKAHVME